MVQIVWTLPPTKYCDGYVCYDQNNRPFRCEDRGYTCCRDNRDQGRILQQFENQFCCQGKLSIHSYNILMLSYFDLIFY